jgi:hypothetical protein
MIEPNAICQEEQDWLRTEQDQQNWLRAEQDQQDCLRAEQEIPLHGSDRESTSTLPARTMEGLDAGAEWLQLSERYRRMSGRNDIPPISRSKTGS